jgi:outer membrane protein assembly factor BamD
LRRTLILLAGGIFLLCAVQCDAQFLHKKKVNKSTGADNSAEPDKVLYLKALDEAKKGHQEISRLDYQTLINTYPDSEYLAKSKLGIADSYYKEGGTANGTQAVQAYKDFIVFFPFLPEAPYAQLQVANTHYRQMEKPDRDRTEAREAENEFQTFLQKYPNDPLADKAQQHLRDVQEVLAEGDYRIAYYYYVKGDKRAAASRLTSVTKRYPLFSKSDHALWMLGDLYETSEKRDVASKYYAQIVRDYPKSELVGDAKYKLKAFGVPIPQPDPNALAWMTANQNTPRAKTPLYKRPLELVHTGPVDELQVSARVGTPTMTQESDAPGTEVLSGGNHSQLTTGGGSTGKSVVATVVPGSESGAVSGESVPSATETSSPDAAAPAEGAAAPAGAGAAGESSSTASGPAAADTAAAGTAAATGTTATGTTTAAGTEATSAAGNAAVATPAAADGSTPAAGDAASTDSSTDAAKKDANTDGKESTSKKKKGIKKIIPW